MRIGIIICSDAAFGRLDAAVEDKRFVVAPNHLEVLAVVCQINDLTANFVCLGELRLSRRSVQ